jgi:hypothetical protein
MNIDDCYSEKERNANGDIIPRMSCVFPVTTLFPTSLVAFRQDPLPIWDEQTYGSNPPSWDESRDR